MKFAISPTPYLAQLRLQMVKHHFEKAGIAEMAQCSATLGFELIELDMDGSTTRVRFEGKPEFCNPFGTIQGGFLAAMIDDAMGMLATVKLQGRAIPNTIDLNLQYLRPVKAGKIEVAARITGKGRTQMFAEAELFDGRGKLAVRAITSFVILPKTEKEG